MNRDEVKHRKSIPKQDHARMILGDLSLKELGII
jgi:hypothetical protein